MGRSKIPSWIAFLGVLACGASLHADGGWTTQDIQLQAGWNLIWVKVDPVPDDPGTVLKNINYDTIWTYTPGRLQGDPGAWTSFRKDQPPGLAFLNTLIRIQGDRGYLIKVKTAGTLSLTGRPVNRNLSLSSQMRNLFGADSKVGGSTTFANYFSHPNVWHFQKDSQGTLQKTLKVSSFYKMNSDGSFTSVLTSDTIASGVAYWLKASQDLSYSGPIAPDAPLEGLQYGTGTYSQTLSIEVPRSTSAQTLTLQALSSAVPPNGEPTDASGNAAWLEGRVDSSQAWQPLTAPMTLTVAANESKAQVEIRCVRKGKVTATEKGTVGALERSGLPSLYQGLIQITDSQGNRRLLSAGMEVLPANGVWIGQARMTQVSKYPQPGQPVAMADAKPLTISLILALPGAEGGDKKLLDQAYVEVSRDGRILKYRYNAIMFHEPVTLTGEVAPDGTWGTLTGTITVPADHALNPYRHRYNPEHRSGYDITRQIRLTFSNVEDPLYPASLAESSGDNELSGTYTETISGVSLQPITTSGYFKLHRLSDTTQLQKP